jgi:hypothetical protein
MATPRWPAFLPAPHDIKHDLKAAKNANAHIFIGFDKDTDLTADAKALIARVIS